MAASPPYPLGLKRWIRSGFSSRAVRNMRQARAGAARAVPPGASRILRNVTPRTISVRPNLRIV